MSKGSISIYSVDINTIKISPKLQALFPLVPSVVEDIKKSILERGFDMRLPIRVSSDNYLIDGYHRLRAMQELEYKKIKIVKEDTNYSEDKLVEISIRANLKRRHLSSGDILKWVRYFDEKKQESGAPHGALAEGKTSEVVAEEIGISARTVERARAVDKNAPEEVKNAIANGEMTINRAYVQIKKQEQTSQDIASSTNEEAPHGALSVESSKAKNQASNVITTPPEQESTIEDIGKAQHCALAVQENSAKEEIRASIEAQQSDHYKQCLGLVEAFFSRAEKMALLNKLKSMIGT